MKHSLGRRPVEVKFAFILAVTLLLPGVTSRSVVSIATTSTDVTSGPKAGDLEKESVLDKFKLESGSEGEHSTELDGTLEDDGIEEVGDINEIETADLEESPVVNNETGTNDERNEDDALALFSLLVKRAVDEEIKDNSEDESETDSVDEDKFSISDVPKLLKPLIDAFSDESRSEAPSKDDFLSWFPSLRDLFESKKPRGAEATNSAAPSGRRSSFTAASEPSLQIPPVSAQPPEPEILPSSQPDALIATVPTMTRPPITIETPPVTISKRPITIDLSDESDSDEDSEMDF